MYAVASSDELRMKAKYSPISQRIALTPPKPTHGRGLTMHDDRRLVEARLDRVMAERIRPAVYAVSVPLDLAAWPVPGEPVPVTDALAAS